MLLSTVAAPAALAVPEINFTATVGAVVKFECPLKGHVIEKGFGVGEGIRLLAVAAVAALEHDWPVSIISLSLTVLLELAVPLLYTLTVVDAVVGVDSLLSLILPILLLLLVPLLLLLLLTILS